MGVIESCRFIAATDRCSCVVCCLGQSTPIALCGTCSRRPIPLVNARRVQRLAIRFARPVMSPQQVTLAVPSQCPKCFASGWAHLHRNYRGTTIALEWQCENCKHRWLATLDHLAGRPESPTSTSSDNRESELLREIASLREANEDLRASALWWRQLYDNAIDRSAGRDDKRESSANDTTH